ncbi:class A beta-lactamase [Nocardia amamiensis]|uniref:Beta-lactamase n=1 Tax=Nocardia amamiensis TaxID=404578 RepID=A0ABS0CRV7_9NOCA|nr:class A beta-lactamase [Nocardia amamiensis]MBF6299363.1 class A beta-lactamase [Nocardia amamiensis]
MTFAPFAPQAGRRRLLAAAAVSVLAAVTAACGSGGDAPANPNTTPAAATPSFIEMETNHAARLGVYATDTASGRTVAYRDGERFPMASTFKGLACGALLRDHPLSTGYFDQVIHYPRTDLVEYSPVTEKHVDTGMTVAELCDAAITVSDNTAGNQLLKLLGGPAGFTAFLRSIGDNTSRLDRWETELNTAIPGDERDTTTPAALAADYRVLVLGDVLGEPERERLKSWLIANTTGDKRIRAGLPAGWTVGDKTGSPAYGSALDVAIAWPPGRAPLVIAVLTTKFEQNAQADNPLVADAARAAVEALR